MTTALSQGKAKTSGREPVLDWLRAIAAIWVVLHHLWQMRTGHVVHSIYDEIGKLGWLGVPIFFVISGYCISRVAERAASPVVFGIQRIFRIMPAYWMSLILIYGIAAYRLLFFGANDMMQSLAANPVEGLMQVGVLYYPATSLSAPNWVYWSLIYELAFYLLIAFALIVRSQLLILLIVVSGLSLVPSLHMVPGLFFLDHWGLFAMGFGLDRLIRRQRGARLPIVLAALGAVSAATAEHFEAFLVGAAAAAIIWVSARGAPPVKLVPLQRIGEWSYSLYLLHVPLLVITLRKIIGNEILPLENTSHVVMYDAFAIGIGILAAALSFYLVESPGIRIGQMLASRLTKSRTIRAAKSVVESA